MCQTGLPNYFVFIASEVAANSVEGGTYISSEFQLGQVYMGDESTEQDDVILYRPVYACIPHEQKVVTNVIKDAKENSFAQNRQESPAGETKELMLKPNGKNATREDEAGIDMAQNKTGVVLVGEVSESGNSMGMTESKDTPSVTEQNADVEDLK